MATVPPSSEAPENDGGRAPDAAVLSSPSSGDVLLEKDVPISQSLIWRWQRDSYARRGLKSWTEDRVPHFITNNPFFAEIYARIVFGFVCDCLDSAGKNFQPVSPEHPLRILELGAGPGKFSFLFLRHLEALLRAKAIAPTVVRYCMSDCSQGLIEAWQTKKELAAFVEQGILQFELIDAGQEMDSAFLRGDASQPVERAPLVVIANYVLDSLPYDAFVIEGGKLSELLQTSSTAAREGNHGAPEALSLLQFSYKNVETGRDRYADQFWNEILETYRLRLSGATVLFPSQALRTFADLAKYTDGTMLLLVADKGIVNEAGLLLSRGNPAYEFHSADCFSQMVNFDAIAKYFAATGGDTFLPDKDSSSLYICAFLQRQPGSSFPATRAAYQEAKSAIGADDLFALLAWLNPHMEEMSVSQILALLRLSRWDPTAFLRVFPVLQRQLRNLSAERNDVREAVLRTWANHFPLVPGDNVLAFYCGIILLELQFFAEASSMLKQSQELLGRSAATSYNLGLCSMGEGRSPDALALMIEACELDPVFEPAQLMRRKLEG
jgi:hypothetical protein